MSRIVCLCLILVGITSVLSQTENPTTYAPTHDPTYDPTVLPSSSPSTYSPTRDPTYDPTTFPVAPTSFSPTSDPTYDPTSFPSSILSTISSTASSTTDDSTTGIESSSSTPSADSLELEPVEEVRKNSASTTSQEALNNNQEQEQEQEQDSKENGSNGTTGWPAWLLPVLIAIGALLLCLCVIWLSYWCGSRKRREDSFTDQQKLEDDMDIEMEINPIQGTTFTQAIQAEPDHNNNSDDDVVNKMRNGADSQASFASDDMYVPTRRTIDNGEPARA